MEYFHRRNRPSTEYSGHEDISGGFRLRIAAIYKEYVRDTTNEGYFLRFDTLSFLTKQQLPTSLPAELIATGEYDKFFTLVEILHDYSTKLTGDRGRSCRSQLAEAFRLSGSVYALENGRVRLKVSEDTAQKLQKAESILSAYPRSFATFFEAVGDLLGRRRKPDDIVKDLFVGAEDYLKAITGENDFGSAVKVLGKQGVLNSIQRAIFDKLYGYRSDAHGVGHAGNSPRPSEADALWFLETMLAQLLHVDRVVKKTN